MSLEASTVRVHGPPRLYFEPLKLLDFDNADPDPDFHLNADPDPASKNKAHPCSRAETCVVLFSGDCSDGEQHGAGSQQHGGEQQHLPAGSRTQHRGH